MSSVSNLLLGGAIVGVLGILFAPDSGENTRRKLKSEALVAKDKLAETAGELKQTISSTVSHQKENLETQLESVMTNVSYKADDIINTLERKLKELKAKNKDLQQENGSEIENEPSTQTV
jgi:gas vesicle protein